MDNLLQQRLRQLSQMLLMPDAHVQFLYDLRDQGVNPPVIYDIGSCVLHWYHSAVKVWPQAQFHLVEAQRSVEFLYKEKGLNYHLGVLGDSDRKHVTFWQNEWNPGGNSCYRENELYSPHVDQLYSMEHKTHQPTKTLDSVIQQNSWPLPHLIKMDVQGAEHDVLRGMTHTLPHVNHLILELQSVEYNTGAPMASQVISYLEHQGFECVAPKFCDAGPDADYYFRRRS